MRTLDKIMMKNLSFPDFEVQKMEFSPKCKILKVFVEGAWLAVNGGIKLGKGILFFNDWDSLSINRFDPISEKWVNVEINNPEELRDLCEVRFVHSSVSLCGFGKLLGHWIEWSMVNTKMHAEFD